MAARSQRAALRPMTRPVSYLRTCAYADTAPTPFLFHPSSRLGSSISSSTFRVRLWSREPTIISERRLPPNEPSSNDPAGPPSPLQSPNLSVAELRPRPFISRTHLHPLLSLSPIPTKTRDAHAIVARSKFSIK